MQAGDNFWTPHSVEAGTLWRLRRHNIPRTRTSQAVRRLLASVSHLLLLQLLLSPKIIITIIIIISLF